MEISSYPNLASLGEYSIFGCPLSLLPAGGTCVHGWDLPIPGWGSLASSPWLTSSVILTTATSQVNPPCSAVSWLLHISSQGPGASGHLGVQGENWGPHLRTWPQLPGPLWWAIPVGKQGGLRLPTAPDGNEDGSPLLSTPPSVCHFSPLSGFSRWGSWNRRLQAHFAYSCCGPLGPDAPLRWLTVPCDPFCCCPKGAGLPMFPGVYSGLTSAYHSVQERKWETHLKNIFKCKTHLQSIRHYSENLPNMNSCHPMSEYDYPSHFTDKVA